MDTPEGRGTIIEVDLLRQRVKVRLEKEPDNIVSYPNAEIAVLRSGKAKKNDLPIPEDLAPISGGGKRIRNEEGEKRTFLDSIKFFEETEEVNAPAEEPEVVEVESEEKAKRNRRNRHRNKHRSENKESASQAEAPAPKTDAPQGEGQQKKNHHRRNCHRHHKPKQNNAE